MADPQTDPLTDILKRSAVLQMAPAQPQTAAPISTQQAAGVPPASMQAAPAIAMAGMGHDRPAMEAAPIGGASPQRQKDQAELDRVNQSGSGVSQFEQKHHILGGLLRGLDIAGSVIAPGLAMQIPGTTMHHQELLGQDRNAVSKDLANESSQAKTAQDAALTNEANAKTDALKTVPGKEQDPEKDAYRYYTAQGMNPADAYAKILDLKSGNKAAKEETPEMQAYKSLLDQGLNPADAYAKVKTLGQTEKPDTATQDDQKYEGLIQKALLGQKLTPEEQAQKAAYEKRKTLGIQTTNVYANQREDKKEELAAGKQDTATKAAAYKAYGPALDSAERFNVMSKNYEDAVKDHNQQAMLSLLANHLGMTMGLQKGARLNKDIIQEAQKSMPWLQSIKAKWGPDGYLQGVTLSPEQMRQMVDLGRERFAQDISKSRNESKYLGAKDDGPDRTASKATINFYMGQAGGNVQKAKQLAAEDGWSL